MPTIITRGLGYDEPTIIYHDVASFLVGEVVVEARLYGTVIVEAPPVGRVATAPIPVFGTVVLLNELRGLVRTAQAIFGVLKEEGPLMPLEVNTITMYIRDDRTLSVSVNTDAGAPVDLTDAKMWFTVKQRSTDPDDQALIQKRTANAGGSDAQVKVITPATGKAEIYIVPADTLSMNPGTYIYDIQVTLASGKTYTITRDKITFKEDVTKATA